ncbi:HAMP domain-containing sensor histidine kinase [Lutibacter sp.]|uniref:sensor histidine kinase n=1 Tax=Lutibacter sp. TaxID=1925666 RepID=UPI001A18F72A|nr:HAMP domain-containing sensor histidine kinase [Lutibacter sp.]MBI9042353.1 HAMP domain-containing histidine kinase [Lutibacter sp.]
MNKANYKLVVYFIALTIIITIMVQVYWNYREYEINKQNLISKVQFSLDNSVEAYFANLTKSGIITYTSTEAGKSKKISDTIVVKNNSRWDLRKKVDSTLQNIAKQENKKPLLIKGPNNDNYPFVTYNRSSIPKNIDSLISKVFISISRDTLDLTKLDSYLSEEFKRHKLNVNYALKYNYKQRVFDDSLIEKTSGFNLEHFPKKHLVTSSKSTFLPHHSNLELLFTNETKILLRNSFISILLSLLLSISIIASLVYLLKTIYKQKQLAEVKNDLINNITHEFKTPIATISTALEAMKNFNALNDKAKSEKYIEMANSQVGKLSLMVEKILETAALNHESLTLTKELVTVAEVIETTIDKYKLINAEKIFKFINNASNLVLNLDVFHFENAIGNIIDNAIKYGGNTITVELESSKNQCILLIKDNGNGIHKAQKDKVFEQFYRIPTGNTHNVKGFGIGLYYTKKIIEKHGGEVQIIYDKNNNTLFKITLPNE